MNRSSDIVRPAEFAELVRVVGTRMTELIQAEQRSGEGRALSYEDERQLGHKVIGALLRERRQAAYDAGESPLTVDEQAALARQLHDHLFGLGRLQPYIEDPNITDIHCGGHADVFVHYVDGTKERVGAIAESDDDLVEMIRTHARRVGRNERRWDKEEVALDLQLPDGSRLHAIFEVTGRPVVDIRRHNFGGLHRLHQLVQLDVMDKAIAAFLAAAVRSRSNIVLAGSRGIGKTTNLRCLINEVPGEERIITIEDSLELGIERFRDLHPDVESMEARPPNSEGKGAFTMADCVHKVLRMKGRIIVGETRGDEVVPLLKALSSGDDGSMCTIHALSSANVFQRFALYAAMAPERLPSHVTAALVSQAINFVVFLTWDRGTPSRRRVHSIREVVGSDGEQVISNEIWAPDALGRAVPHARLTDSSERSLAAAGFDLSLLEKPDGWWTR